MARASRDWSYLTGGAAAAVVMPALVFGLGAPLWIGLIAAAAAFGGLVLVMQPRGSPALTGGRGAVAQAAIAEAEPALDRLEAASGRIKDRTVKSRAAAIADIGREVIAEIEETPASLSTVQRLLTYYIPRAAELTEGYADMEREGVGAERRASISDLLVKLQEAFGHYREQLADEELRALDVDIRLVGDSLTEDLGAARPPGGRSST